MADLGTHFTSGNWIVKEGKEKEFIEAWTEFVRWSTSTFDEFQSADLIQQDDDSRHFISFGLWTDASAVPNWRGHPEFPERMSGPRSLCDEFAGLDYKVVSSVS